MNSAKNRLRMDLTNAITEAKNGQYRRAHERLLRCAKEAYTLAQKATGDERVRYLEIAESARQQATEIATHIASKSDRKVKSEPTTPKKSHGESSSDQTEWQIKAGQTGSVKFDDIAGLDDVKDQIRTKIIYPFLYPKLAKEYQVSAGGGLLLFGPPGTGKTMIAKATANEVNAAMFSIIPSDIMSKWVGESEQKIRQLFAELRKHERAILFIDELEGLMPNRNTHSTVMQRVVPQFLAEMDGLKKRSGSLLLMGATNVPWLVDSAAYRPGRFDAMVYVPLPDLAARRWLIEHLCRANRMIGELGFDELAERLEFYSGADIESVVQSVLRSKFQDAIRTSTVERVEMSDFLDVIQRTNPSVREKDLKQFERFKSEFDTKA